MKIEVKHYPAARADASVRDDYFGTEVADPYRWLETSGSEETRTWIEEENAVTEDYLSQIPFREAIRRRLTELSDYPKYGLPERHGPYTVFFENDGLRAQSVCYIRREPGGEKEVLLDPNTFSSDGTAALMSFTVSRDNRYAAYGVSSAGSDWQQIRIVDLDSRQVLPDVVGRVKFSEAVWADGGFYYSRYDEPEAAGEFSAANACQKVCFHRIGTFQAEDELVFEDPEHPLRYFTPYVSRDGEYLFVLASEGTSGTEVYCRRRGEEGFRVLFPGFRYDYLPVECENGRLLMLTNADASMFRLTVTDLTEESPVAADLIPASDRLLERVSVSCGRIFAMYLCDASSEVRVFDREGRFLHVVALPAVGTVTGFGGGPDDPTTFYSFVSFNCPPVVFEYHPDTGESTLFRKSATNFDPDDFVVEQRFFESKDKTRVPMFVCYRKGLQRNGKNLAHLSGYGGFDICRTPAFSPADVLLMEQGGVYASVNLRGGGEYGEAWHRAGMLSEKQNVFDDFMAAADFLIAEGYTGPGKIAASGGSNGGLLVGACLVQRPDLYTVVFPRVGVLDMLRYHKFTVGWGWVVEYGSSDNAEQFAYLLRYSPLHNIRQGVRYPSVLVMTADHDDRVVPAHSFKFAATLQAAQGGPNPVLIRIDDRAGHGAGKPTGKMIDEWTDMYAFMFHETETPFIARK